MACSGSTTGHSHADEKALDNGAMAEDILTPVEGRRRRLELWQTSVPDVTESDFLALAGGLRQNACFWGQKADECGWDVESKVRNSVRRSFRDFEKTGNAKERVHAFRLSLARPFSDKVIKNHLKK